MCPYCLGTAHEQVWEDDPPIGNNGPGNPGGKASGFGILVLGVIALAIGGSMGSESVGGPMIALFGLLLVIVGALTLIMRGVGAFLCSGFGKIVLIAVGFLIVAGMFSSGSG
tara:strand:- start:326 stop:661 length:336 start_codon:yes stop_codon:yes gene_type:complete